MANHRSLPDVCELPCPTCCKMAKFPKEVFLKGGIVKCKACGASFRLQPHKNGGRKKADRRKWRGCDPDSVHGTV